MATTITKTSPHVALFPCSGIGHLMPFLHLAKMLDSRGCTLTFITLQPTVSKAESDQLDYFFTNNPHIKRLEFQPMAHKKSNYINEDPFFIQNEAICNSVHLLKPILSSLSPPLSAIIADFVVAKNVTELASDLPFSVYVLIVTSARFFSIMVYLPQINMFQQNSYIEHPSLGQIPVSIIPPQMLNPNHFFSVNISSNASSLSKVKGILVNTFHGFESESIESLNSGKIVPDLPPILPIGPSFDLKPKQSLNLPWLDQQTPESVIFICFGSRTALSNPQITELANGIHKSGCKFLWVLKFSKVDKEDKEEVHSILGQQFLEKTREKGLVIKGWVDQDSILAHPAIGGFMSHAGWNSVTEAARLGVPVLAWPQHGDQRVNAEVVEKVGFGLWIRDWSVEKLVPGDEIAEKIREVMVGEELRGRAKEVMAKARQAWAVGGDSERVIQGLIEELKIGEASGI